MLHLEGPAPTVTVYAYRDIAFSLALLEGVKTLLFADQQSTAFRPLLTIGGQ
jgi:hypothetical protein